MWYAATAYDLCGGGIVGPGCCSELGGDGSVESAGTLAGPCEAEAEGSV